MKKSSATLLVMLMLVSTSIAFPIDFTQYLDAVDENNDFVGSFPSLERARQDTRHLRNVIYIVQKNLPAAGRVFVYVGETVNDVASRYGELTSGLRDVIPDRWEDVDVNVDVYQMDRAVDRTDEEVIRLIREDMITRTADVRLRLKNRRGLLKGMSRRERAVFRAMNSSFMSIRTVARRAGTRGGKVIALMVPTENIKQLFEKGWVIIGAKTTGVSKKEADQGIKPKK